MSRHRLTARKRAFAEALVLQRASATEAARVAGYAGPHEVKASKLMARDKGGRMIDRALESYIRELREQEGKVVHLPKGQEVATPVSVEDADACTPDEVIATLRAIMLNEHEPAGGRIRAAEALLKHLGADRPTDAAERDAEAAKNAIKTLLGIA